MDEATRVRVDRAKLLTSLALDDWAELEMRFGAANGAKPHVIAIELAALADRRGEPDKAIRYMKRFAPGYLSMPLEAAPEQFWRLAFPMPYRQPLERYSRDNELDPYLVAALIRQESEFNPKAISSAKAYGLTQVLPSTGRSLSRKLGLRGFTARSLFDPEVNLKLGTHYLKALKDQLGGNWEATLASYNAGKTRAVEWMTWGTFEEPAEFIETIPFSETRNYIQIVLRNADVYRRLYGSKTAGVTSTNGITSTAR
jgi:soluble lytic murein transglycosylase